MTILHVPIYVFQDHYSVIYDDPDGQDKSEEGERIYRKAKKLQAGKGPDDRYRDGHTGNKGSSPVLEKKEYDKEYKSHGLNQSLYDLFDRDPHKCCRVIGDVVFNAVGKMGA